MATQKILATWLVDEDRWAFGIGGDAAVEITAELHADLFAGQRQGMEIGRDENGQPILVARPDPLPLSGNDLIKAQIVNLEAQQTPRRMREAALGIDNGWLAEIDAQIAMLRAQL